MADPRTLHHRLLAGIDRMVREHEERCGACYGALPADDPDACKVCASTCAGRSGPIYAEQAEREARSPGLAERRATAEQLAAAALPPEAHRALGGCGNPACDVPWHQPGASDMSALWTAAVLTSTVTGPLPEIEDWANGDVMVTLPARRSWWRRIWRRRG